MPTMNPIEIRQGSDIPEAQLIALYNAVNWTAYTNDENKHTLKTAVQNSTYVVTAWNNEQLVGLARVISDDISICYLQDILVRPDYQRLGIGRILLSHCLERFDHVRTMMLLTDNEPKQIEFYKSLGFKNTRDLKKNDLNAFVKMKGVELE
jgi:ribosomal protein S18 acetylase RimI-like enzyme